MEILDTFTALSENMDKLSASDRKFADSLLNQFQWRGSLSGKQWHWVKTLAKRAVEGSEGPATENVGNFNGVIALFEKASAKLKWPKIRLSLPDGQPIVLSRCGSRSKSPGAINVTDGGPYGSNIWYGRVNKDGTWTKSRDANKAVGELLRNLANEPEVVASEYGRRTGNCCFCKRGLTDKRSVGVGYGPICADHYGLPWGEVEVIEESLNAPEVGVTSNVVPFNDELPF